METLAALVPQMMPYYLDKAPRPVYQIRASANGRTFSVKYATTQ